MALSIAEINHETNSEDSEYVKLYVTADNINLGNYGIYDTTFNNDGKVSNTNVHLYRFPKKDVIKGDIIYIYTGKNTQDKLEDDKHELGVNSTYNFFQNYERKIWNKDRDKATVIFIVNDGTKQV